MQELRKRFKGCVDPRVTSGEMTETAAYQELVQELHTVAAQSGDRYRVSFEEFEQYYATKLGGLPTDDAFCTAISRQWGGVPFISGKVSPCAAAHTASAAQPAVAAHAGQPVTHACLPTSPQELTQLEKRILDSLFKRGGNEREVLTKVFRKYDTDSDGKLDIDEFHAFCEEARRKWHVYATYARRRTSALPTARSSVSGSRPTRYRRCWRSTIRTTRARSASRRVCNGYETYVTGRYNDGNASAFRRVHHLSMYTLRGVPSPRTACSLTDCPTQTPRRAGRLHAVLNMP